MGSTSNEQSPSGNNIHGALPTMDHRAWRTAESGSPSRSEESIFHTPTTPNTLVRTSITEANTNMTSTPPSVPTTQQYPDKDDDFVPPARPSSTPFPFPERHETALPPPLPIEAQTKEILSTHSDIEFSVSNGSSPSNQFDQLPIEADEPNIEVAASNTYSPTNKFDQLPTEVHEAILDHLFGFCVSATSKSGMRIHSLTRSWGTVLRHSRRREMTSLARVNRLWRVLVQQRLYRHIKVKGSTASVENAIAHFAFHQRLAGYVRHAEIWFPVFRTFSTQTLQSVNSMQMSNTFQLVPDNNCSLEDAFQFMALVLPDVKVLTLEGGERRSAPQVTHFSSSNLAATGPRALNRLFSVKTLITKGQWNLIRRSKDFSVILTALPCLDEWQASYSKPKAKSYINMAEFLPQLPPHIRLLSVCIENDYRKEAVLPAFYARVVERTHMCLVLAAVMPTLEQFSYTGRVCYGFFETALRNPAAHSSILRSIDVTVKNCCCRQTYPIDFGSGIQEMTFISAFEQLVVSGIRALKHFKHVDYMRIRFVDLGEYCML